MRIQDLFELANWIACIQATDRLTDQNSSQIVGSLFCAFMFEGLANG